MRQLTFVRPGVLEWWDVPAPRIQNDRDALVRPLAVTRCDLDLYIANGTARFEGPFAIGHETAGIVTDIGDAVRNIAVGDEVIVPFQISCGACRFCLRGLTNACEAVPFRSSFGLKPVCGVDYGGALSDLLRVPFADHMLVKNPAGLKLSQTSSLADSATDAFSVAEPVLRQNPEADVVVIGGRGQSLGIMIAHAAKCLGAPRVLYVDNDGGRLAKAREYGIEVLEIRSFADARLPRRFFLAVDADGSAASLNLAVRSVEPGGICHRMYGGFEAETPVPLAHMYGQGITLKIGRVNARASLPACLAHVEAGHYHPETVLTRHAAFEEAHEAILDPSMKVVFVRDGIA
jgi:alcohol dehydrogenase